MNKESIFDNHYKNEYILLKLLYISSREISKQEICEKLKITLPTLSKIVSNIQNDFYDKLQNSTIQFIVKRNTLKLQCEGNISLDELATQLIKNSYKFKLLETIFFNNNKRDNNLEIKLNISNSTLNRVINSCNQILLKYNLRIKKGRIEGSLTQYCYFYYMLFLIAPKKNTFSNQTTTKILNAISNNMNISVSNKKKLNLWIFLLIKNLKIKEKRNLTEIEKRNLKQTSKTKIFKQLKQLYIEETIINNTDEAETFAYFLCLFFVSFGIVSYSDAYLNLFRRENPAFELTNKIISLLRLTFVNINNSFEIVENNIFTLIAQLFYFNGKNFLIDTITTQYYKDIFNNSLKYAIAEKIVNDIIKPSKFFNIDKINYIKENLPLCLYVLIPKNELKVNIAILAMTSNWIMSSLLALIEKRLNTYQSIVISEYKTSKTYDLLVTDTDVNLEKNSKNFSYYYKVTAWGIDIDFDRVINLINDITLEKYYKYLQL